MKLKKSLCIGLLFFICYIYLSAITRIVDIDGTGQYTSIQTAINACVAGDTVLVYPGRYLENIIIQTNNISLISLEYSTNNPAYIDSTIIDGHAANPCLRIYPNALNINVRGISITNGFSRGAGAGVSIFNNTLSSIINCKIFNNVSGDGAGIAISECTALLSGLEIFDNKCYGMGGGVYIYGYSVIFDPINRCSIYNNTAGSGQDIYAQSLSSDLIVYLNTFSVSNPTSYYAGKRTSLNVDFQLIFDIQNANHQEINNDLYVSIEGDDDNDGLSPNNALKTIHTAIYRIAADSLNQKTVHIQPGTYSRSTNQQVFPIAMKSWVKLVGNGIASTILITEHNPLFPNQSDIVFNINSENDFLIQGLSITANNSTNSSAISGQNAKNVQMSNIYIYGLTPSDISIIRCNFFGNCLWDKIVIETVITSRFGLIEGGFQGIIRNCTFRNATSTFVSDEVWAYPLIWMGINKELTFENCIFDNLIMYDDDSQTVSISGVEDQTQPNRINLIDCQFTDITCPSDIIVIASTNNPIVNVTNCTFAGNSGNSSMFYINGIANITNSIFYNDTLAEIRLYNQTGEQNNLTVDYSCLRRGQSGISGNGGIINYSTTNISNNPLFLGEEETEPYKYYLAADSPCINAGTPDTTGLFLPQFDLLGNARIYNDRIDMGAYEWNGTANQDNSVPVVYSTTLSIYPNPFKNNTTISYTLEKAANVYLEIYNTKGQKIKTLVNARKAKGEQVMLWDGSDEQGRSCKSGIYIIKFVNNHSKTIIRKVTIIK